MDEAIRNRDLQKVKTLVEAGADVNTVDIYGRTALFMATFNRDFDLVKYLIKKGANVNLRNSFGETPLYIAAFFGDYNLVKYLIKKGADVNVITNDFDSAVAISERNGNYHIAKYLIKMGADYSLIEKNGELFQEILRDEINNLKSELTKNYLTLERANPNISIGDNIKYKMPKSLLLKSVYEVPYQQYCSVINKDSENKLPPIQLIALANILKIDYDIDISWVDLCNNVKKALYLFL